MEQDDAASTRTWLIAAAFFTAPQNQWIDDFVPAPRRHRFSKIPSQSAELNWHNRKTRYSGLSQWASHWEHGKRIFAQLGRQDGIITVFPPLALVAAVRKLLYRRRNPLVAYCFNVGAAPGVLRRVIGRIAFRACDAIVVHSSAEITLVNKWFAVDPARIHFLPLQCGVLKPRPSEQGEPYVVAMGSANRDYPVLIEAAARTGIRTIIVAAPRILEGLNQPDNVEFLHGLSMEDCRSLVAGARFSVIPLTDGEASSGQITLVEAMRLGCPTIATSTIGTVDYVRDGATGFLVPPGDPAVLAEAMRRLWDDDELREGVAQRARAYAEAELSDEAAGRRLSALLDRLVDQERA
ncbi:glycosyltransferase family 4 protein [Novosphingobium piscinae]|uniref:Glycosyltransferase family 4 protein n=1 Tax=Novosphingobium piscinae TaxID=1507448 RepID=A0A7X1FX50_9SPHN|nr:glycosyltransferase family 4 protein [Novosphingobium piscinae]MBC2667972.1 glycosyltransferase family 4 protein [Novosphingobium piscinae]